MKKIFAKTTHAYLLANLNLVNEIDHKGVSLSHPKFFEFGCEQIIHMNHMIYVHFWILGINLAIL